VLDHLVIGRQVLWSLKERALALPDFLIFRFCIIALQRSRDIHGKDSTDVLLITIAFMGAFLAALWLSMVIWAFRDIRSRTRDDLCPNPGALASPSSTCPACYLLYPPPPETLAEAYTRSLEEEALLQGIEEADVCPGCGQRALPDYIVCPRAIPSSKRLPALRTCNPVALDGLPLLWPLASPRARHLPHPHRHRRNPRRTPCQTGGQPHGGLSIRDIRATFGVALFFCSAGRNQNDD